MEYPKKLSAEEDIITTADLIKKKIQELVHLKRPLAEHHSSLSNYSNQGDRRNEQIQRPNEPPKKAEQHTKD